MERKGNSVGIGESNAGVGRANWPVEMKERYENGYECTKGHMKAPPTTAHLKLGGRCAVVMVSFCWPSPGSGC